MLEGAMHEAGPQGRGRPPPRAPAGVCRGSSLLGLLVAIAVAGGLVLGGRALWRRTRLEGYHAQPSAIEVPEGAVVLYTASWCGKSKKAKEFLAEKGIAFQERDVDRTPGAQDDLRALGSNGVPVLVVAGRRIVGFNREAYAYLLEYAGFP